MLLADIPLTKFLRQFLGWKQVTSDGNSNPHKKKKTRAQVMVIMWLQIIVLMHISSPFWTD